MRDLITARREREAERLGFWDASLERITDEGTVKSINNKTPLDCPQLTVPESTSLLPTAETHPLGRDPLNYLERVMTYLDEHPEPVEPDLFRELAVHELVQASAENEQSWVYERRQRCLLDGKPLADATAADLLRDGLAALGWARTRALLNRHGWDGTDPAIRERYGWGRTEWLAFAAQSLEARPVSPPPVSGVTSAPQPHQAGA